MEHKKEHPIPIYAAAELLALGNPSAAREYLQRGFRPDYAAMLLGADSRLTEFGVLAGIKYPLNKHITDSMHAAFVSNGSVSGLNEFERQLLGVLQLTNEAGELTPYGLNRTIELFPLDAQCAALNIPLVDYSIPVAEKLVELDTLRFLNAETEFSTHCESGPFIILLFCILVFCLRELARDDPRFRDILRQKIATKAILSVAHNDKVITEKLAQAFVQKAEEISVQSVNDCLENEYKGSFESEEYPKITPAQARNLFNALTSSQLRSIAEFFVESPYKNMNGWPDLTIFDSGDVQLAEVKVRDRLHYNQISTIPRLKTIFDRLSVIRVQRLKKIV